MWAKSLRAEVEGNSEGARVVPQQEISMGYLEKNYSSNDSTDPKQPEQRDRLVIMQNADEKSSGCSDPSPDSISRADRYVSLRDPKKSSAEQHERQCDRDTYHARRRILCQLQTDRPTHFENARKDESGPRHQYADLAPVEKPSRPNLRRWRSGLLLTPLKPTLVSVERGRWSADIRRTSVLATN